MSKKTHSKLSNTDKKQEDKYFDELSPLVKGSIDEGTLENIIENLNFTKLDKHFHTRVYTNSLISTYKKGLVNQLNELQTLTIKDIKGTIYSFKMLVFSKKDVALYIILEKALRLYQNSNFKQAEQLKKAFNNASNIYIEEENINNTEFLAKVNELVKPLRENI